MTHFKPAKASPYLGMKIAKPATKKNNVEAKRMPRYTAIAESLRKPAFARRIFSADCSSSVCGMSGLDKARAVSMIPCMRGSLEADCCVSRSISEAGRLRRARRSWARLFRWEITDSSDQTPKMKTPKTRNGMMSFKPTNAKITMASPRGFGSGLRPDVNDSLAQQSSENLTDQAEDT